MIELVARRDSSSSSCRPSLVLGALAATGLTVAALSADRRSGRRARSSFARARTA